MNYRTYSTDRTHKSCKIFGALLCLPLALALAAAETMEIEAESGRTDAKRTALIQDAGASGGKTVRMTGINDNSVPSPQTAPDLSLPFTLAKAGTWQIRMIYTAKVNGGDSVFWRLDQLPYQAAHTGYPVSLKTKDFGEFTLAAGKHEFQFRTRESGLEVDRIILTRVVPSPKPFDLKVKPGQDNTYSVTAPADGIYYLRQSSRAVTPGPWEYATLSINGGVPLKRAFIWASFPQWSNSVERIELSTDKPVSLRIQVSPNVKIEKLWFVPVPKRLPEAAAKYQYKVKPRADHPRLLVNRELLPKIKANLDKGINAPAWQEVQSVAKKPYSFTAPKDREVMWDYQLVRAMRCKAFYYLMTGNAKIGREAADLALAYFAVVNFGNGEDICRRTGEAIYVASMVYDWCRPLMTDKERKFLRDKFIWHAGSMEIGWPPFLQGVIVGHGNEDQLNRDLLAMAIAVYDENPEPWRYCAYRFVEEASPMKHFQYRSGRHDEGVAYGEVRFNCDAVAALQLRRSCGWEHLPAYAGKVPYAWFYYRTPDGQFFTEGDDYHGVGTYPGNANIYHIANALWPDTRLKSEYLKYFPGRNKYYEPVFFLLTSDPEQQPDDRRDDLPPAKYFGDPIPALLARTGWNNGYNSNDVTVEMIGPGYQHGSHQHGDAGSFQLYYRGPQAADIGQYYWYGPPYDTYFAKTTMSHSCMRFCVPGAKDWRDRNGVQRRDGSPDQVKELQKNYARYTRGKVLNHSDDPHKPYLQMDLAASYPGKVKSYVRALIFLPQKHPALIVYDEFTAKPGVKPVWQLTTIPAPKAAGNTLVADSALYGFPARLTVQTLLPKVPQYAVMTGKAAHTVEKTTYQPPFPDRREANGSRTELTAEDPQTGRFLNVLFVTPGTNAPQVRMQEAGNAVTLRCAEWTVRLVQGKAPEITLNGPGYAPEKNAKDSLYLDGKLISALQNGTVSMTRLLTAKKIPFTDRNGILSFDGMQLKDGESAGFLPAGKKLRREGGAWPLPAEAAASLLNCSCVRDPWNGCRYLTSRPGKAKFLLTSVNRGPADNWRKLLEDGTGNFVASGTVTGNCIFRKPETLSGIALRFTHGDQRQAKFRLELSADGKTFKTVFSGMSSGKTTDFESFKFAAQKVLAVRFTFAGNTDNGWNSVTGIRFLNR